MFYLYSDEAMTYPDPSFLLRPSVAYPEYPFESMHISSVPNTVYEGFRNLLARTGLDASRFGSEAWNPLGEYIARGDTVLVKPNLVMDTNPVGGLDCLVTNASLIAAVVDYVWIALGGTGRIVVADAPMQTCNFDNLVTSSGLKEVVEFYSSQGIDIELADLRGVQSEISGGRLLQKEAKNAVRGKVIDLGAESKFAELSDSQMKKVRITNYDPRILRDNHNEVSHKYCISEAALGANVIVNMPKIKTHRKAGLTAALKNMIGVNTRKEYLPHHMVGSFAGGGDEYLHRNAIMFARSILLDIKNRNLSSGGFTYQMACKAVALLNQFCGADIYDEQYVEGSWYGNDTIWRTVSDINKLVFACDSHGSIQSVPQRKMIVVGDLIVAGEGEGPLSPSPAHTASLTFSDNPFVHDAAIARLAGSEINRLPSIGRTIESFEMYNLIKSEICSSNRKAYDGVSVLELDTLRSGLKPSRGWAPCFCRDDNQYLPS